MANETKISDTLPEGKG